MDQRRNNKIKYLPDMGRKAQDVTLEGLVIAQTLPDASGPRRTNPSLEERFRVDGNVVKNLSTAIRGSEDEVY